MWGMSTDKAEAARAVLRSWRRRYDAVTADRDPAVNAALAAGLAKEEVHVITSLGRGTIDRIAARAAAPEPEGETTALLSAKQALTW